MKSKEEIKQLADKIYFKVDGFEEEISESKRHFIQGYTQCQEDMAKLTFVPGLDKETLDELFDLHDDDDFIHEDSDKKYTEEDIRKAILYGQTTKNIDYHNDFINSLNKQD